MLGSLLRAGRSAEAVNRPWVFLGIAIGCVDVRWIACRYLCLPVCSRPVTVKLWPPRSQWHQRLPMNLTWLTFAIGEGAIRDRLSAHTQTEDRLILRELLYRSTPRPSPSPCKRPPSLKTFCCQTSLAFRGWGWALNGLVPVDWCMQALLVFILWICSPRELMDAEPKDTFGHQFTAKCWTHIIHTLWLWMLVWRSAINSDIHST